MVDPLEAQETAIAIGVAMENACAIGNFEVAERLFETYRLLYAACQDRDVMPFVNQPTAQPTPASPRPKLLTWW